MAIDKSEIDKYIFDPENPKQCLVYKLLLNIAKKQDIHTYISKDFFYQFFISDEILNQIEKELWDIPNNYKELSKNQKIDLYIKQFSSYDFLNFLNNVALTDTIFKKIYLYIFSEYRNPKYYNDDEYHHDYMMADANGMEEPNLYFSSVETKIINVEKDFRELFLSYKDYAYPIDSKNDKWNGIDEKSKILLYNFDNKNILHIEDFFKNATVLITTLEHKDKFLEANIPESIKPIFLKKIEDIELLLNVLEHDINKTKNKDTVKEDINKTKNKDISNLDAIVIEDFFSIKNLKLENLKDKKEIYILGENGDGKTLLLQSIVCALKAVEKGVIFDMLKNEKPKFSIIDSDEKVYNGDKENTYENVLAYGANRNNNCLSKEDEVGYLTLFDASLDLKDPIKWLINLEHSELRGDKNILSLKEAKAMIKSLLNSDVEIDIKSPTEVIFTEKGSPVKFDRLSAGYKGVITIVCDILVRLSAYQSHVTDMKEYQGVVLIDEVELHLHPKWKYDFMKKIREIFPLIQFIVTTHSPTVILGASKEAVFYKIYKEDGEVCISNQMANEGYTNNSLISSPLFDLKHITSRDYDKKVSSDDFIYEKIHKVVSKRIEENINIDEEEILKLIDEELDKI